MKRVLLSAPCVITSLALGLWACSGSVNEGLSDIGQRDSSGLDIGQDADSSGASEVEEVGDAEDQPDLAPPGDAEPGDGTPGEDASPLEDLGEPGDDAALADGADDGSSMGPDGVDLDGSGSDGAASDDAGTLDGPGACCTSQGCAIVTGSACLELGATFHGVDSTCEEACPPSGACCSNSNQCAVVPAASCTGDYKGNNSTCTIGICFTQGPQGACCAQGLCSSTSESTCTLTGGTWTEGLTCAAASCTPPEAGACCTRFGCAVVQQWLCVGPQSSWKGAGTTCEADCP